MFWKWVGFFIGISDFEVVFVCISFFGCSVELCCVSCKFIMVEVWVVVRKVVIIVISMGFC